jgi:hypothetical protein
MWLLSVDKIPELIEGGDQGANETVRRLKEKTVKCEIWRPCSLELQTKQAPDVPPTPCAFRHSDGRKNASAARLFPEFGKKSCDADTLTLLTKLLVLDSKERRCVLTLRTIEPKLQH